MSHSLRPLRLLAAGLLTVALTLLASPALAHVRVLSEDATQGGFGVLTFRVPTESDTASTTKVQVTFPEDQPLAFVAVKPHAGWTYTVQKRTLDEPLKTDFGDYTEVVASITWTADGGAIKPGEFDEFQVQAGPLPEADSMTFKAVQTYSDGTVARWIEPTPASGEEPEFPAPTLALAAADAEPAAASPTSSPSVEAAADSTPVAADEDGDSALPTVLAVVALLVALGAGGLALGRRRG